MKKAQSKSLKRLLTLYKVLPRYPQQFVSVIDLKQKVMRNYSDCIDDLSLIKAIRRDLDLLPDLLSIGELLTMDGKGNQPKKYQLSKDACIEPLSSELSLTLVMANEYLQHQLPNEIYSKVEGFFQSAESQLQKNTELSNWNRRIRFVPDGYGEIQKTQRHIEIQQLVFTALLDANVWLKGRYKKEGTQQTKNYVLKPQGIIHYGQKAYLMACKIHQNKSSLRTFNLMNFEYLEIIPEKLTIDVDGYDLDELIEDREFEDAYFDRVNYDIFLVIEEKIVDELALNPIGDFQSITKIDEGYYELRASCVLTTSRLDWFMQKAEYIQIIGPDELRNEIKNRLIKASDKQPIDNPMELDEFDHG